MNGTQGVIILMGAALALYLLWNSHSPFNSPTTIGGKKLPDTGGSSDGGITSPPSPHIVPGSGNDPDINTDPHFPVIPAEILGPYTDCLASGGHWDSKANRCIWNG